MKKFSEDKSRPSRALQIWLILIGAAHNRQIITYGHLTKLFGMKMSVALTQPLGHIMYYCIQNNLPPLTVLVVNKETGRPGDGLLGTDLDAAREKVFEYPWYDLVPPTREELDAAYKTGEAPRKSAAQARSRA